MSHKILLVDDDEKLRKLVTEYLEGYGFHIIALPDGSSLMETIQNQIPDVVILDIMLPGRNGLDLLRDIRSQFSIPIIMLTAKGDDADRIVGLELGADDYMAKPFNPRELLARVKAVIRRISFQGVDGAAREGHSQLTQRQLRAILSADVEGYSRLMAEDEMHTIQTLNAYRDIIAESVQSFLGRVVDTPGDNILAEFGSVLNAVQCAIKIQKDIGDKNAVLPAHRKMAFRIGINLGDVVIEKGRIYGTGVNIASRIERIAEAGGLCISGTVYDQIENQLQVPYRYLGEKKVKNILKPIRVYQVEMDNGS